ncbi:Chaperone protein ClpB 2 like protein [Argiope bruennichi]|uniref:Chaperone protein ClpB 2 like protein n=1 Tax=Argiope bruennichi TaxID=94029 RepID=A0A8T0EZX0_ARGBR|nr:Chaperone protein ClpB 2 like protein [Argiope bruennichi]
MGITEGAIPFAVKYPKFIISNVIGGMIAAFPLCGVFQISDAAAMEELLFIFLVQLEKLLQIQTCIKLCMRRLSFSNNPGCFLITAGINIESELLDYTKCLVESGDTVNFKFPGTSVDKHSSGGVGDKVSLIIGPILASFGFYVAKMSGRGLAQTGGTIDKMESIPNLKTDLSLEKLKEIVEVDKFAISSATLNLVPGDKVIYALRDVTATVDSIDLIAASIMSKKLAFNNDYYCLDVKCGSGSFCKELETAKDLAKKMLKLLITLTENHKKLGWLEIFGIIVFAILTLVMIVFGLYEVVGAFGVTTGAIADGAGAGAAGAEDGVILGVEGEGLAGEVVGCERTTINDGGDQGDQNYKDFVTNLEKINPRTIYFPGNHTSVNDFYKKTLLLTKKHYRLNSAKIDLDNLKFYDISGYKDRNMPTIRTAKPVTSLKDGNITYDADDDNLTIEQPSEEGQPVSFNFNATSVIGQFTVSGAFSGGEAWLKELVQQQGLKEQKLVQQVIRTRLDALRNNDTVPSGQNSNNLDDLLNTNHAENNVGETKIVRLQITSQEVLSTGEVMVNAEGTSLEHDFDPLSANFEDEIEIENNIDLNINYSTPSASGGGYDIVVTEGVGKTAIVEGLVQKIVENNVPTFLQNALVYQLDMSSLIAGASFQGEFESRLKAVINKLKSSKEKIILFVDELHTIVGAGRTQGAMDASNILKPALAKEKVLRENIVGQDFAIKSVCDAILRSRVNIKDPNRPIGAFVFLGSTGVGKTELAKNIAKVICDSENNFFRFDMSEYSERHSVSKLVGSPPGYIGYEKGGTLTEKVYHNSYCVILIDEMEKAHSEVLNLFLQVMDNVGGEAAAAGAESAGASGAAGAAAGDAAGVLDRLEIYGAAGGAMADAEGAAGGASGGFSESAITGSEGETASGAGANEELEGISEEEAENNSSSFRDKLEEKAIIIVILIACGLYALAGSFSAFADAGAAGAGGLAGAEGGFEGAGSAGGFAEAEGGFAGAEGAEAGVSGAGAIAIIIVILIACGLYALAGSFSAFADAGAVGAEGGVAGAEAIIIVILIICGLYALAGSFSAFSDAGAAGAGGFC